MPPGCRWSGCASARRLSVRWTCSTRVTTPSRTSLGAICGRPDGAPPPPPPAHTAHTHTTTTTTPAHTQTFRPAHHHHHHHHHHHRTHPPQLNQPKPNLHSCTLTRRAQQLSFAIWLAIREQNHDLQPVLEAAGTGDRLRLALLRLRALREQIKGQ